LSFTLSAATDGRVNTSLLLAVFEGPALVLLAVGPAGQRGTASSARFSPWAVVTGNEIPGDPCRDGSVSGFVVYVVAGPLGHFGASPSFCGEFPSMAIMGHDIPGDPGCGDLGLAPGNDPGIVAVVLVIVLAVVFLVGDGLGRLPGESPPPLPSSLLLEPDGIDTPPVIFASVVCHGVGPLGQRGVISSFFPELGPTGNDTGVDTRLEGIVITGGLELRSTSVDENDATLAPARCCCANKNTRSAWH